MTGRPITGKELKMRQFIAYQLGKLNRGKVRTTAQRKNISDGHLGIIPSQTTLDKRRSSMQGKNKGRIHTDQTRKKNSDAKIIFFSQSKNTERWKVINKTSHNTLKFKQACHWNKAVNIDGVDYYSRTEASRQTGLSFYKIKKGIEMSAYRSMIKEDK